MFIKPLLTSVLITMLCNGNELLEKLKKANAIEPSYPSYVDANHLGLCLKAKSDLPAGTIVATADMIPTDKEFIAEHPLEEYKYVAVMKVINGKPYYGKVRGKWAFCNHSCDPSCVLNDRFELMTRRAVQKGEELTTSYDDYVEGLPWQENWNFTCRCLSSKCVGIINKYRMDMQYPVKNVNTTD